MKIVFLILFSLTWQYVGFHVLKIDQSWMLSYAFLGGILGGIIVTAEY